MEKGAVVRAWAHSESNTDDFKICCEQERNRQDVQEKSRMVEALVYDGEF